MGEGTTLSVGGARVRGEMLAALPKDGGLRDFVDEQGEALPRLVLEACPRADWVAELAIACGFPVGALLSATADLVEEAGTGGNSKTHLRLARDEVGWVARRLARRRLLGSPSDGPAADEPTARAALTLAQAALALRPYRARKARKPQHRAALEEPLRSTLGALVEARCANEQLGAFRSEDPDAARLRALEELAAPLRSRLLKYQRQPSPPVGFGTLASATALFGVLWVLALGAGAISFEIVPTLIAGVVGALIAIGVAGARLGGEGMGVVALVAVVGLPAGVYGGPGIVRSLLFSGDGISVADAPSHPEAAWYSFVDGRVASELSVQTEWDFRTSLREQRSRRTALAPIVSADWTADAGVPAWAACGDTVDRRGTLAPQLPECRETWTRALRGGRPTTIASRDVEPALEEARTRHGLSSAPGAPVLTWMADPEERARREAFMMTFVVSIGWLVGLSLVGLRRFGSRRRRLH